MSFREIRNILLDYGAKYESEEYFINLATDLANLYIKEFSNKKIQNTFKSVTLEATKVDITKLNDPKKIFYLNVSNDNVVFLASDISITFNLKMEVLKTVINNEIAPIANTSFLEALSYLKDTELEIDLNTLQEKITLLNLQSLIYSYTFGLLQVKSRKKRTLARAGMFRNAYFEIIEFRTKFADLMPHLEEYQALSRT